MRTGSAFLLALALCAAPRMAHGQTMEPEPDETSGPTFQDTTGITWAVGTVELGLVLAAVGIAAADSRSANTVGILALGAAVVAAGIASGVAQGLDAPVEPAMVWHHGFSGGAMLGGLMSFTARVAGLRGDAPGWIGLAGLVAGAAAMATYSVLRMERLAHDPQLLEEAHVLSWSPILAAGLVGAVLSGAGLGESGGVIATALGLVAIGVSIALVEVAIAENPVVADASMSSPLLEF